MMNTGFESGQTENIDVKACPFCSSCHQHIYEVDTGVWAVYCAQCEAIGPHTSSMQDAIVRWGNRV